jgi:hypothetical protein
MSTGLFTPAFEAVTADNVSRDPRLVAYEERGIAFHAPTNAEIMAAAQKVYDAHMGTVDTNADSGGALVTSPDAGDRAALARLRSYDWSSMVADPEIARPVLASPRFAAGKSAAEADEAVATVVIGANIVGQVVVGAEGGIGIAFGLVGDADISGMYYYAYKLGLVVDISVNLFIGLWRHSPKHLAGSWYSLDLVAEIAEGIGIGLAIHLTPDLDFHGFSLNLGVGFSMGIGVAAGNTARF